MTRDQITGMLTDGDSASSTWKHLAQLDEQIVPLTFDQVTYYNSLQVILSYRTVYCPVGEFLLAAEICSEHPEICSPNPLRVQSS